MTSMTAPGPLGPTERLDVLARLSRLEAHLGSVRRPTAAIDVPDEEAIAPRRAELRLEALETVLAARQERHR